VELFVFYTIPKSIMRKVIYTDSAPAPIGPYSQAILQGHTLYVSGQIALDPKTGELKNSSIEEETHRVLDNLMAILKAAGMDSRHVAKCTVFVTDIRQFAAIHAVYATYFPEEGAPARELVEVSKLPRFVNVEISCIAYK
jgi:2-iminobutanoate/2-iminopropanoate deaminase